MYGNSPLLLNDFTALCTIFECFFFDKAEKPNKPKHKVVQQMGYKMRHPHNVYRQMPVFLPQLCV